MCVALFLFFDIFYDIITTIKVNIFGYSDISQKSSYYLIERIYNAIR